MSRWRNSTESVNSGLFLNLYLHIRLTLFFLPFHPFLPFTFHCLPSCSVLFIVSGKINLIKPFLTSLMIINMLQCSLYNSNLQATNLTQVLVKPKL